MSDWITIASLYLVGIALLIIELFLPAHGLLGLVGVGILGFAVYETYIRSEMAGLVGLGAVAVLLPVGLVISVKFWHHTPVGRRISPPNPVLTELDRMPVEDLRKLVGTTGKTMTMLRPVGMCLFNGRRVECTSEQGVIETGVEVEAIRLVDRTLSVRPVRSSEQTLSGPESGRNA
jgi:membrane-bound serine protease (ClpP class)